MAEVEFAGEGRHQVLKEEFGLDAAEMRNSPRMEAIFGTIGAAQKSLDQHSESQKRLSCGPRVSVKNNGKTRSVEFFDHTGSRSLFLALSRQRGRVVTVYRF